MSKIRFYLDENVSNTVAEGLRTHQIEVLTTPEAEHMGWSDEEHLAFALEQNYVFITQDDDFLTLARKIEHAGIAYYKPRTRTVKEILLAYLRFTKVHRRKICTTRFGSYSIH